MSLGLTVLARAKWSALLSIIGSFTTRKTVTWFRITGCLWPNTKIEMNTPLTVTIEETSDKE
jgi:hypothetical protein